MKTGEGAGPSTIMDKTKYMRWTLVFMWNSAVQENFVYFSAVFCYFKKKLGLEGRLDTGL